MSRKNRERRRCEVRTGIQMPQRFLESHSLSRAVVRRGLHTSSSGSSADLSLVDFWEKCGAYYHPAVQSQGRQPKRSYPWPIILQCDCSMPAGNAGQYVVEIYQVGGAKTGCKVPPRCRIEAQIGSLCHIEVGRQATRVVCHVVENERTREEHVELLYKPLVYQGHTCCPDGRSRACSAAGAAAIGEGLPLTAKVERQVECNRGNIRHF